MGWFKRKAKVEESKPQKLVCNHKYKDFPWYYEASYNTNTRYLVFKIIEPFVCIHCKERTDRVLYDHHSYYKTYDEANDYVTEFKKKYAEHMEDRVIIEDMIADMQLVDRDYLAIAEALMICSSSQTEKKPIELKIMEELKN